MKTIKQTITSGVFNTTNETKIEVSITDETGRVLYPQEILFVNDTDAAIGVLYIQNDEELADKNKYPDWYQYVSLDANRSNGLLPANLKYIFVKKLSGTATGNLDFYLISYV